MQALNYRLKWLFDDIGNRLYCCGRKSMFFTPSVIFMKPLRPMVHVRLLATFAGEVHLKLDSFDFVLLIDHGSISCLLRWASFGLLALEVPIIQVAAADLVTNK